MEKLYVNGLIYDKMKWDLKRNIFLMTCV